MAKNPSDEIKKLHDGIEKLSGIVSKNNTTVWRSQAIYGHLFREIGQGSKKIAELTLALTKNENLAKKASLAYLGYHKALESGRKILGTTVGTIGHYISRLTDLSYWYNTLSKSLNDYNKIAYETSKLGEAIGKSFDQTTGSIKLLADATSFSRQESVEFFKTIYEGQSGFIMSNNAIINLAKTMQSEFGPSLDMVKDKMNDLLSIQEKDIGLFEKLDELRKDPSGLAAYLSLLKTVHGVSNKQLTTLVRYVGETDKAKKGNSQYEKGMRNLLDAQQAFTSAFADLKIETAEKLAEVIVLISNSIASVVNYLADIKKSSLAWGAALAIVFKALKMGWTMIIASGLAAENLLNANQAVTNEINKQVSAERQLASAAAQTAAAKKLQSHGYDTSYMNASAPTGSLPTPKFGPARSALNSPIGSMLVFSAALYSVSEAVDAARKRIALENEYDSMREKGIGGGTSDQTRYTSDEAMAGTRDRFNNILRSGDKKGASDFLEKEVQLNKELGYTGDANILKAKIQIQLMDAYAKNTAKVTTEQQKGIELANANINLMKKTEFSSIKITMERKGELQHLKHINDALELELSSSLSMEARWTKEAELKANTLKMFEAEKNMMIEALKIQQELASAEQSHSMATMESFQALKYSGEEMSKAVESNVEKKKNMLKLDREELLSFETLIKKYPESIELRKSLEEIQAKIVTSQKEIFMLESVQGPIMALENKKELLTANMQLMESIVASSETLLIIDNNTVNALRNKLDVNKKLADNADEQVKQLQTSLSTTNDINQKAFLTAEIEKKQAESIKLRAELAKETLDIINRQYNVYSTMIQAEQSLTSAVMQRQETMMGIGVDSQKILEQNISVLKKSLELEQNTLQVRLAGKDINALDGIARQQALQTLSKIAALEGQIFTAELDSATKVAKRKQDLIAAETNMLKARLQLEEASYFGIGATMKTRFDVITRLEQERTAIVAQRVSLERKMATATLEEQIRLKKEIADLTTAELNKETELVNLAKDLREGYLSALGAFAVGAGKFDKIISRQEFGTRRLLEAFAAPSVPQLGGVRGGLSGPLASFGVEGLRMGNVDAKTYQDMLMRNYGVNYSGMIKRTGRIPGAGAGKLGIFGEGMLMADAFSMKKAEEMQEAIKSSPALSSITGGGSSEAVVAANSVNIGAMNTPITVNFNGGAVKELVDAVTKQVSDALNKSFGRLTP